MNDQWYWNWYLQNVESPEENKMTYHNGYWYPKCNDRMFKKEGKVDIFDEETWSRIREAITEIAEEELRNDTESTDN